ncbi:hypothetical protein [Hymenobacter rubripertinctus]|uniref:Uncharacterized protein n=1 Tax=Hymenobacter rubripertinctus TaxID=2029981 RepID=A0A418QIU0_9BACT|nr:hypothetical protein [Hymenobacter rubripertinctus]RIY05103.1 hypothetical protein D0T11_21000 [Hymenobacter rubripertinctus]
MKTNFLLAAALLLGSVTVVSAQTTPSSSSHGRTRNQTNVPLPNPANPTTNPGTIDQRTPTRYSPTQTSVGALDRTPAVKSRVAQDAERQTPARTTPAPRTTSRRTTSPASTNSTPHSIRLARPTTQH